MKIQFKNKTEVSVVENYDWEEDWGEESIETFEKDEEVDCDLVSENEESYYVQFGDGSVAFIHKDHVIVLPE